MRRPVLLAFSLVWIALLYFVLKTTVKLERLRGDLRLHQYSESVALAQIQDTLHDMRDGY